MRVAVRGIAVVLVLFVCTGVVIWGTGALMLLLPREMHDPVVRWGVAGVFGVVLGGYVALRMDRSATSKEKPRAPVGGSESTATGERSVAARDISGSVITGNVTGESDKLSDPDASASSPLTVAKAEKPDDSSAPTRSIAHGKRSVAARDIRGKVITGDTSETEHL